MTSAVPPSFSALAGLSTTPSLGSLRAAALTQSLRSRTLHSMLVRTTAVYTGFYVS